MNYSKKKPNGKIQVGDVVLRRERGEAGARVLGQVVVLRLKVKSNQPVPSKGAKVKFAFLGADYTKKENRSVGDLFFKDVIGHTKDKAVLKFVKQHEKDDRKALEEAEKAKRARAGNIPPHVFAAIDGHFGCNTEAVLGVFRQVYAKKTSKSKKKRK